MEKKLLHLEYAVMRMSHNPNNSQPKSDYHDKTEHIAVHWHFINEI